jgi:hypothetical protein
MPAAQAPGERQPPGIGPALAPDLDPRRDQRLIGPGVTAQRCSAPPPHLVRLALGEALKDPCHVREQITTAAGELADRSHRGGALVAGQFPPPGMALRLAVQLRDQDPVRCWHLIEHAF